MEIHAFDKIEERVAKLVQFKENKLFFDQNSCLERYQPALVCHAPGRDAHAHLTREEVESQTGESYENALYMTALVDSVMDYGAFDPEKFGCSKEDYLKINMPLAIFCAEIVASQCVKNVSKNQASMFEIDEVSEKLLDSLVTLEAQGAKGLHVTYDMKDKMSYIMRQPSFLVILNKELGKENLAITSGDYADKNGHVSEKVASSRVLKINLAEKTK